MGQSMILRFFGGVSLDRLDWAVDFDKVLFELARWLLPIAICLLAEGICMERRGKMEMLSCYRYKTFKMWWRRKYAGSLLYGTAAAAVLFIAAMAVDVLGGATFPERAGKVFLLWIAHIMTIVSFFSVLDLTGLKKAGPAILLLLEGLTFLVGFTSARAARFMYGMWGMYFQSGWYDGGTGISVVSSLAAEGLLLALGYLAGQVLLGKTMRGGRR